MIYYHGNEVVALNYLSDFPHFLLHIACPDLTDNLTGICKCGWHFCRLRKGLKTPIILQHLQGAVWRRRKNYLGTRGLNSYRPLS